MNKIKKFFKFLFCNLGFKYKVNMGTKEIHDLTKPHVNCHTDIMTNYLIVNKKKMEKLMTEGFNGCRFCMKKYDKG